MAAHVRDAERPLRLLLGASIVLPLALFALAAWLSYHQHFAEARRELQGKLGHVYEHALKVFETLELAAKYTDELFADVPDNAIAASEAGYHQRLRVLTDTLPQLRDIWLIGRDGHPVVSGTIYPMPRAIDLSDRDWFVFQKNAKEITTYISPVLQSRAADRRVIVISRRRNLPGSSDFGGVATTAIAPDYFTDYYARLPAEPGSTVALVREDGVLLARHPPQDAQRTERLPAGASFLAAVAASPDAGGYESVSPLDGAERIIAYRKLPRHPVYIIAGRETPTIVREWMLAMTEHLLFGLPATIALVLLSWTALRRARRESLAHARLQQEVARRESTEQTLRQAQKMEAVGRLTGGIAHDFNNLLTAIMGNADLAARRLGSDEARVRRSLTSVSEAAKRAAALVQRLLSFSRQHPQEVRTVDINRLVRDMSDLLQRTLGETVAVEAVLAAGLWKTSLDQNQLENAILNLAVNARDAMPEGGRLTIESANAYLDEDYLAGQGEKLKPGQYVLLAISDSGTGMTKEVIQHAFDPFFTTKPQGVGTGLGLSMVYGFVKQSAGHIKIYSEVGEGTTLKLYFPRASELELAQPAPIALPDRQAALASDNEETILLVEDDEKVNQFGAEILSELGYDVLTARDGTQALALIERHAEIALLFTDVVLPGGINGRKLAEEARRLRPALRVLYTTGYTRNAIVHHGRLDPGVEVLMKPYSFEQLGRKVRQVLDGAAAGARAAG